MEETRNKFKFKFNIGDRVYLTEQGEDDATSGGVYLAKSKHGKNCLITGTVVSAKAEGSGATRKETYVVKMDGEGFYTSHIDLFTGFVGGNGYNRFYVYEDHVPLKRVETEED